MHLAHANAAVMISNYDDPLMADFVAQLDPVNAAADSSPGFVWRLDDDNANEDAARVFGTDAMAREFDDSDSYRVDSTATKPDHLKRPY